MCSRLCSKHPFRKDTGARHADAVPCPHASVSGEWQEDTGTRSVQASGPAVQTIPSEEDTCPAIQAAVPTGSPVSAERGGGDHSADSSRSASALLRRSAGFSRFLNQLKRVCFSRPITVANVYFF